VKKWRRVTHEDTGISCEVGRLTWRQRPLMAAMIGEAFAPIVAVQVDGASGEEQARSVRKALAAMDEETLAPIFETKVRAVEGLEGITTGRDLLDEAPDLGFVLWLLNQLVSDASASEEEGKASGSPSTSSSVETAAGDSPVPSTVPEGGPTHSTAPEMTAGKVSSTRVA